MLMHGCKQSQVTEGQGQGRSPQALPSVISQQEDNRSNDTQWPTLTKHPVLCQLCPRQPRCLPTCPHVHRVSSFPAGAFSHALLSVVVTRWFILTNQTLTTHQTESTIYTLSQSSPVWTSERSFLLGLFHQICKAIS